MDKGPKYTFYKEDIWIANRSIKKCSILPEISEMYIKTIISPHAC